MRRIIQILLAIPLAVLGLMTISFVGSQVYLAWKNYPAANQAPDWNLLAKEEIPSLVTVDPDESRRITQVWIANIGQTAYLRTGDSLWFRNLQRDPELELRIGGMSYPCGTQVVMDTTIAANVHEAFRAKYPKRSAMFRVLGVSTNTVLELDCRGIEG